MDRRGVACDIYIKNSLNLLFPLHFILILEVEYYHTEGPKHLLSSLLFYITIEITLETIEIDGRYFLKEMPMQYQKTEFN